MNTLISDKLDSIKILCENHNVKELYAFGSISTDYFTEKSDVDLLVSFNTMGFSEYADNYFIFAENLEKLFNRHVDLITEKSLSNPYFVESVNKSRVQIYG
jgi:uncharacterized protein